MFFRHSVQGSSRGFLQGSLDMGKILVCAGVFLLAVGGKADLSRSIAMCGNMCQ